jgi:hypothetical protein
VKKKKLGDFPPPVLKFFMPSGLFDGIKELKIYSSVTKSFLIFLNSKGAYSVKMIFSEELRPFT